jgi:hypothetical protein
MTYNSSTLLTGLAAVPSFNSSLLATGTQPSFLSQIYANNWIGVRPRFNQFLANLNPTQNQIDDARTKLRAITRCLNQAYWNSSSETDNTEMVGSWGKGTCIRPPTDADMIFLLPNEVYWRFDKRGGNKQSDLLQEVKGCLESTYPQTTMRGDGQVVMVRFNSICFEVVPAFIPESCDGIIICDTNNGGRYKITYPLDERRRIQNCNAAFNSNAIHLIKMAKCWRKACSVPIPSFHLEHLAVDFVDQWPHRGRDAFWYDWMMRDFFIWLAIQHRQYPLSRLRYMLASREYDDPFASDWQSKTDTAVSRAVKACNLEYNNQTVEAGQEWQKIFGDDIPVYVL